MLKRTISGAVLILVMIGLMGAGGWIMLAGLLAMSLVGLYEFYHALKAGGHNPFWALGMAAALIYYAVLYLWPDYAFSGGFFLFFAAIFFMVMMIVSVFSYPRHRIEDVALTFIGVLYVPVLFSFLYFLRTQEDGAYYVWYAFMASWGCDTCAYLAGRAFGRHKMAPELSPKKTVEGAVGGVLGAILLSVVYTACIASHVEEPAVTLYIMSVCVGLFGGCLGQIGDLFASAVKRVVGIKDYGKLIPGHGGILDRYDSTLLVAPVVTIVIYIILQLS